MEKRLVIRHAGQGDFGQLEVMHKEQGFDYELPKFDRKDWIVRAVIENEPNRPEMGLLFRKTAEAYLLIGRNAGHGDERIGKILALQKETFDILRSHGFSDVHAWLPSEIERNFGRHLLKHGWKQPSWSNYVREI